MEHLAAAEKLAGGKPGVRWLRYAVLKAARRNEELKNLFLAEAGKIEKTTPDEMNLANHLLGQANGVLEANEMLTLLDALRPVFAAARASPSLAGWKQQRAGYLSNAGRGGEATAIYRELAEGSPRDYGVQVTYDKTCRTARNSKPSGSGSNVFFPAMPRGCRRKSISSATITPSRSVPKSVTKSGDVPGAVDRTEPRKPDPYTQYLDALYYTDRSQDANALMDKWFRDDRRDNVTPAAVARLQGAINWILNQCQNNWNYYNAYHIDERWQRQLVETAVFFCRDTNHVSITEQIMNDWRFQQPPQGEANQKLRAALAKIFVENFDRLTLDELDRFIGWLRNNDSLVTKAQWNDFAGRLQKRYAAEANAELKTALPNRRQYPLLRRNAGRVHGLPAADVPQDAGKVPAELPFAVVPDVAQSALAGEVRERGL